MMQRGDYIRNVQNDMSEVQFRPAHNLFAESYNAGHRDHFQMEIRRVSENRRKHIGMFNLPLGWYNVDVYRTEGGYFVDYDDPEQSLTVRFTSPTGAGKEVTSTWGGKIPNRAPYPLLAYVHEDDDEEEDEGELCVVLLMKQKWERVEN
jgi:hypothetical protein